MESLYINVPIASLEIWLGEAIAKPAKISAYIMNSEAKSQFVSAISTGD